MTLAKQKRKSKPQSVNALAIGVGVSRRTMHDWIARGCPRGPVKAIEAWRAANIRTREPAAEGSAEEERVARIRKLNADSLARELKNAKERKEIYLAADVETNVAELTGMIRTRLESIPDELQTEWPPECRQLVTERLSECIALILTSMSQWRLPCDDDVTTDATPADEPEPEAELECLA